MTKNTKDGLMIVVPDIVYLQKPLGMNGIMKICAWIVLMLEIMVMNMNGSENNE